MFRNRKIKFAAVLLRAAQSLNSAASVSLAKTGLPLGALGPLAAQGSIVVALVAVAATPTIQAAVFAPVNVEGDNATVRLSVLGTYRGGWFSRETPTGPAYDPRTQRIFSGSVDRQNIEVLDISDPLNPNKINSIDLSTWVAPNRIAVSSEGIVAATTESSSVLLFNAGGDLLADVNVPKGVDLAFTPDGQKLVVTIDRGTGTGNDESAVDILDLSSADWDACRLGPAGCNLANPPISTASFNVFNGDRNDLIAGGARFPTAGLTVAQDIIPEGLTISSDSTTAWVTLSDNNAIAELNLQSGQISSIFGLGTKDNSLPGNGFDASDKDGINIQTWPIKSFFNPDNVGVYEANGQRYLVTPNEGDARDPTKSRLKDLTLHPGSPASGLQGNNDLGRLKVSNVEGLDGDGDYSEVFGYGGRSFAIWATDGTLIFDSGDDFEQRMAAAMPNNFNTSEDELQIDTRSDDRGPEPESLDIGTIDGRTYVFIGFERIGGVMVYDITDPTSPIFEQYINNRDFSIDPKPACGSKGGLADGGCELAGDLEPEGVLFISAEDSPLNVPLLALGHELSDSVTLYRLDSLAAVPEPSTFVLSLFSLLGLAVSTQRRKRQR